MRCAPEWRNLSSTSGKGLKNHTITAHLAKNLEISDYSGRSTSGYLPRRGRIKEGEALAVYFAMNISRGLGDIHRSGHFASATRLPLGAGITEYDESNMVFHLPRAAPFGSQGYHLSPEGGTT